MKEQVTAAFEQRYDERPSHIIRSPGRVNLIGERSIPDANAIDAGHLHLPGDGRHVFVVPSKIKCRAILQIPTRFVKSGYLERRLFGDMQLAAAETAVISYLSQSSII